ncbi:MAG TPA: amidohydrolase family protein [Rhodopila sp.]|uniref:amidohydrolase family protein n=1 Tax=Rhodopila sp. TaxID=2480087 RepID=UPI002B9B125B|nr:amidohydrolase family protein [Rhodopila sp.]HVY15510.1 amidohydrolase family protein [Rhodopila sp.]
MDLIIRNARLPHAPDAAPVDIGVADGRIVAIAPRLAGDGQAFDAGGQLACAGLVETHIHLDKTRIIDRCPPEDGRNANAVPRVAAVKHTFTEADVYRRASQTLENCIKFGTTRMRTHVELDGGVEMRSYDALETLRRDYAWAIEIELCVFPQEGLTNNPRSGELLIEALRRGAKVIGAAPNYDPDKSGQIRRIFELAREFGTDIDMHLDSGNSPDDMDIHLVCELTKQYGLEGRVAVGHGCKYSTLPPRDLSALAAKIADAGVAVTVLPATDLYMMGRNQTHSIQRGVANANVLVEHGVNCSISSNNILNPFTPLGDGNLIRIANMQANVCQVGEPQRLRECFMMLTERSAKLMNLKDYGLAVGNPADIVIFDATTPEQAVAEVRLPLACFKNGKQTVTRPRAELHKP